MAQFKIRRIVVSANFLALVLIPLTIYTSSLLLGFITILVYSSVYFFVYFQAQPVDHLRPNGIYKITHYDENGLVILKDIDQKGMMVIASNLKFLGDPEVGQVFRAKPEGETSNGLILCAIRKS